MSTILYSKFDMDSYADYVKKHFPNKIFGAVNPHSINGLRFCVICPDNIERRTNSMGRCWRHCANCTLQGIYCSEHQPTQHSSDDSSSSGDEESSSSDEEETPEPDVIDITASDDEETPEPDVVEITTSDIASSDEE